MIIPDSEIKTILSDFPKIELSYETMIHNKVLSDNRVFNENILLAIPVGQKCFTWFTTYQGNNVCFILETNKDKGIVSIQTCLTCFDDKLTYGYYGTIFYGTLFKYNDVNCFSIENIYYYKGDIFLNKPFLDKLSILKNVLNNEMSQYAMTNNYVIFGIPIISTTLNSLIQDIVPYKINHIQIRYPNNPKKISYYNNNNIIINKKYNKSTTYTNTKQHFNTNTTTNSKIVFKITPDIQNDVYNLFYIKDGKEEFYDYADIPDYTTSVMMNKLFRNIKENQNLDLLEESDDEDEFENDNNDKFVYLNTSFNMVCKYNYRFKKWTPVELSNKNDLIVLSSQMTKLRL